MTHKNLTKKLGLLVGISMLLVNTAFAAYNPQSRNLCALSIHPYNPAAVGGDVLSATDTSWFSIFDQSSATCTSHLQYPNAYTPDPPLKTDNPLPAKPNEDDKKAPETLHSHAYYNDSVQDTNYYYKSFVDKFQIILESDALSNTDKFNPVCYHYNNSGTIVTDPGCNGHDGGWGGTQATYNSSTGVIQWEFGVDSSPKAGRPLIYGKNPDLTGLGSPAMPDTTNEDNRLFNPWVKLVSKNNSGDIWSGTTTSRVLVRDQAILKTSVNKSSPPNYGNLLNVGACANDGKNLNDQDYHQWCTLPTPSSSSISGVEGSDSVGGKYYYWFKIGVVGTVWKKPPPPPPTPSCTGLTVTPSALNDTGSTPMTAKVVISDGTVHTANLLWTPAGGNMSAGNTQSGSTASTFNNTFNLTGASGSVKVKVTSISDGVTLGTCASEKEVKTPPPPPVCTGITLTPDPLNPDAVNNMKAHVTFSDGSTQTATVGWTQFGGTLAKTTETHATSSAFTNTFTVTDKSNAGVTAKVTSVVGPALNSPVCMAGKQVKVPPPYCLNITLNKTTISNLGSDTLSAKVHYSDGIDRTTTVTWTPTNLTLTPVTNPETQNSATNFVKITNPVVSGNPVNLNVAVTGVPAGVLNSLACSGGVNASSSTAQCLSLQNSGYTGTTVAGGAFVLFAPNPVNTDLTHPSQVTWTETGNGVLIRNPASPPPFNLDAFCPATINDTTINLPNGCQYFYSTPSTPGTNGSVTITANPNNGGVPACTQTTSFNNVPQNNLCTNLSVSFPTPNQVCVSPNPPGTASAYNWTVNGTLQSNHSSCQNVNLTDTWSVVAQGSPNCTASANYACTSLTPHPTPPNGLCVTPNPPGSFSGSYFWNIGGTTLINSDCQYNLPLNKDITVQAIGAPYCHLQTPYRVSPPSPPRLQKTVRAMNPPESSQGPKGGSVPLTLIPATGTGINGKVLEYKLTFTPTSPNTTATIIDDMSKGYIQGKTNTGADGGRIVYYDHQNVSVQECTDKIKSNCYSGDIGTVGGVTLNKVNSEVTITYQGIVQDSKLTDANCQSNTSTICQERYPNIATSNYVIYQSSEETALPVPGSNGTLSANALVQSFCQYILTRAAGDIYLETDLDFGKNIELCSQYRSSTGLIVTPGPAPEETAPSTGPGGTVPIGHSICNTGLSATVGSQSVTLYGNTVAPNLSSQICEVKLRPGESWEKATITSTIQENKTRVSRWTPNLGKGQNVTINSLGALPASSTGVYHLVNGNLTIDPSSADPSSTTVPFVSDGDGAKTFIVENGDLIIKSNINYGPCNKPSGLCTVRDTASIAFIVLNGNVKIDPQVTSVGGVFFVQQGDTAGTGKLLALGGGDSYTNIVIYGSIYGDIQDLFTHRKYAGDPAANQGSVVIRFDERIILNTPPVLKDVLQLSESQVAR